MKLQLAYSKLGDLTFIETIYGTLWWAGKYLEK